MTKSNKDFTQSNKEEFQVTKKDGDIGQTIIQVIYLINKYYNTKSKDHKCNQEKYQGERRL